LYAIYSVVAFSQEKCDSIFLQAASFQKKIMRKEAINTTLF